MVLWQVVTILCSFLLVVVSMLVSLPNNDSIICTQYYPWFLSFLPFLLYYSMKFAFKATAYFHHWDAAYYASIYAYLHADQSSTLRQILLNWELISLRWDFSRGYEDTARRGRRGQCIGLVVQEASPRVSRSIKVTTIKRFHTPTCYQSTKFCYNNYEVLRTSLFLSFSSPSWFVLPSGRELITRLVKLS
jgi:hypothetical protein